MKNTSPYGFRKILLDRRKKLCMTAKEFAEHLEIPLSTYKTYESGAGVNYRKQDNYQNQMSMRVARKFLKEFPYLNYKAINDMVLQDRYYNLKVKQRREKETNKK